VVVVVVVMLPCHRVALS